MKKLLFIFLLISCVEDEISPCRAIHEESVRVYRQMKDADGDEYEVLKARFLELKAETQRCYL